MCWCGAPRSVFPNDYNGSLIMRSYDAAQDYDFEPDGHGGVRLIPKPRLARALARFKFRDAPMRFLPGKRKADDDITPLIKPGAEKTRVAKFFGDQREEEDPSGQYSPPDGRVIGTLPAPPPG